MGRFTSTVRSSSSSARPDAFAAGTVIVVIAALVAVAALGRREHEPHVRGSLEAGSVTLTADHVQAARLRERISGHPGTVRVRCIDKAGAELLDRTLPAPRAQASWSARAGTEAGSMFTARACELLDGAGDRVTVIDLPVARTPAIIWDYS